MITNETWKITKQDLHHINLIISAVITLPDTVITQPDLIIPNIKISDNNVLDINNQFVLYQLTYTVIGKAELTDNMLDYDITFTTEYNKTKLSNKVYRNN